MQKEWRVIFLNIKQDGVEVLCPVVVPPLININKDFDFRVAIPSNTELITQHPSPQSPPITVNELRQALLKIDNITSITELIK